EYHARLGRAAAKYLAHLVVADERCDESRRIGCTGDEVDVTDAIASAPVRPGHLQAFDTWHCRQPCPQRLDHRVHGTQRCATTVAVVRLDGFGHAQSSLLAEAGCGSYAAVLDSGLQFGNVTDTEIAPQSGGLLGAYPLDLDDVEKAERDALSQRSQLRQRSGRYHHTYLLGEF